MIDPYAGNILVSALGDIPSAQELMRFLWHAPEKPAHIASVPVHVRIHWLIQICDLHLPRLGELHFAQSVDLALRHSYRYRDPAHPATWSQLLQEPGYRPALPMPPCVVTLEGISGTGKTTAANRILRRYPQLIRHETFPCMASAVWQVPWLSVGVPASGRSSDLARTLMEAWHKAVAPAGVGLERRFQKEIYDKRMTAQDKLAEWSQVAATHFLGLLHLDEIQNLFKLETLAQRRRRQMRPGKGKSKQPPHMGLPVADDGLLKWILMLANNGPWTLCISGTQDGIRAMESRCATGQRLATGGYHEFKRFAAHDPEFDQLFLPTLLGLQYVAHPLEDSPVLRTVLLDLTAGIPRMLIALWIHAQRIALERREDRLRIEDLHQAAKTLLAPAMPAIHALNSGDPRLMEQFEDLLPNTFDPFAGISTPM